MVSEAESETSHDIVKMRVLGFFAMIITLIAGFMIPYAILYNMEEPPVGGLPPGWTYSIRLYLGGADFGSGGFQETYSINGLNQRDSALFFLLTLIASLQFISPARGKKRLLVHLIVLSVSLAIWILGVYFIYRQLSSWTVLPVPLTPVVAIIALLCVWIASRM
ncbi:MAG: hypothetical protein R6V83_01095 [Candidatus Thorarchaeota archaeon]